MTNLMDFNLLKAPIWGLFFYCLDNLSDTISMKLNIREIIMIDKIIHTAKDIVQERSTSTVALKVSEETGELAQAINKNKPYIDVVSEVADVIIAAIDTGWKSYVENYEKHDSDIAWEAYEYPEAYNDDLKFAINEKLSKWVEKYGE